MSPQLATHDATGKRLRPEHLIPPGCPIFYVMVVTTHHCNHCGKQRQTSYLQEARRAGTIGWSLRDLKGSERIYDEIEIRTANKSLTTPACADCISFAPREALPKVVPMQANLKPNWARAKAHKSNPNTLDDLDDLI